MTIAVSHEFQPLKDPHQKALHINLDASRYGAFAEIGAGQEIVSLFFHVGGASGTVAKSMSAYDMTVSDSIYGRTGRYVSKERLIAMLDHEYKLLIERLDASRGASTGFFAVADTVSARNFAGTNECHGWMGIRFQSTPKSEPNQILLHVHMMDPDNVRQQEALGLIGVNLTYGAFYLSHDMNLFLEHLLDGISNKRLEVDYVELSGPAFAAVDHKLLTVSLLRKGLASAILFDVDQRPIPSTEFFHKRPILLERGSFRALHHMFPDLVGSCKNQLKAAAGERVQDAVYVLELTLNNILGCTTGSSTIIFSTSATATELVNAATGPQAIGLSNLSPGTDATRTGRWVSVGANDVRIFVLSSTGTGGVGTLVVRYVQGINAP